MASIPNNIVAKDSDGNIKKVKFEDFLEGYAKTEDVQSIVEENLSECIKSVDMSFTGMKNDGYQLDVPFLVNGIKLYTAAYDSETIIYSTQFSAGPRELQNATDAYRFTIESEASPFGVSTNKKCFLVLSFDGYESFSSTAVYDENECRRIGAHGGNPIILDWNDVVLGEGKIASFAYKDPAQQIGVIGHMNLIRRTGTSGNIHTYAFKLELLVCGFQAWQNYTNGNVLTLETATTLDNRVKFDVNLNSIAYPKLSSVEVSGQEPLPFSANSPSTLAFKGENGIFINAENADEDDASIDKKVVAIGFEMSSFAGEGMNFSDGKLNVPTFSPAEGDTGAKSGLVPAASASRYNDILTVSGWKSFDEIGFNSALKPFRGATSQEDGDMGFVPKPSIADKDGFLKADGTWTPVVTSIYGDFSCEFSLIDQELNFGLCLCDSDGRWMFQPYSGSLSFHPLESEEGSVDIEISIEDIYGISLSSPWQAEPPMSPGNNANGWVADKTFWSEDKSRTFSAIFPNGSSMDVWIEEIQDADNPESVRTRVHYRGYGFKKKHARPFLLAIDGHEQEFTCSLAEGESQSFTISGTEIKIWPTASKTRILSDWIDPHADDPEELDVASPVPWGGYFWKDSENKAMLRDNRLVYAGDADHSVSAGIYYVVHNEEEPTLVYGLEPEGTFWDIVLAAQVEYSGEILPEGTVIGHVWLDSGSVKAASKLFANWSVQPVLQKANEPIADPTSGNAPSDEEIEAYEWIYLEDEPVLVSSIGLEISKTPDGIQAYAPEVNVNEWPKQADSLDLHIDYDLSEFTVNLECLSSWLNSRFGAFDKAIAKLEKDVNLVGAVFTGATQYTDGLPGLVPGASSSDKDKVLMGDGTWSDKISKVFNGTDGTGTGQSGLVPAPASEDVNKYLRGDGTWSSPVQEFDAVSSVDLAIADVDGTHANKYNFSAVIPAINEILQSHPDSKAYISIPEMDVSLEPLQGNGISICLIQNEEQNGLEYAEYATGIEVYSKTQWIEAEVAEEPEPVEPEDNPEGPETPVEPENAVQAFAFEIAGQKLIVNGSGILNEDHIQIAELNGASTKPVNALAGLNIQWKHTVSGSETHDFLDLRYKGATSNSNSVPGLVPVAMPEERELYLRGDGTWRNPPAPAVYSGTAVPGLVPPAQPSDLTDRYLKVDGTWAELVLPDVYHGANAEADGSAGLVPAPSRNDAQKYLKGDGTWGSPAYEFSAVTELRRLETPYSIVHDEEYDFSDELAAANAILQESPSAILYFAIPSMEVGSVLPDGLSVEVQVYEEDNAFNLRCTEMIDGNAGQSLMQEILASTEEEEESGIWHSAMNLQGESLDIDIECQIDANNSHCPQINALTAWTLVKQVRVTGIEAARFNTVTGEASTQSVDLSYQGATTSFDSRSGLVPSATSSQRSMFLRADGTWNPVPSGFELNIETVEPESGQPEPYTSGMASNGVPLNINGAVSIDDQYILGSMSDDEEPVLVPAQIQQNAEQAEAFTIDDSESALISSNSIINIVYSIAPEDGNGSSIEYNFAASMADLLAAGENGLQMAEDCSNAGEEMTCLASQGKHMYISCTDNGNGTYTLLPFVVADPVGEATTSASLVTVNSDGSTSETSLDSLFQNIGGQIVETADTGGASRALRIGLSSSPDIPLSSMEYVGATSTEAGMSGFVPAASIAEKDRYLKGDGTWAELTLPSDYVGATEDADGIHGLVPAATIAERGKFLKGDGSWSPSFVVTSTMPTANDEGDIFFYIED